MRSVLTVLALFLFATLAVAQDCQRCQVAQQQVIQVQAAPVVQAVAVPVQAQVQCVQTAPVVVRQAVYAVAPVQQVQVVRQVAYTTQAQVFAQPQVVNVFQGQAQRQRFGRGIGGGFGGGPVAQGFQSGGLLGAAERLTGLGDGSGQVGTGAILGILGARSNLFGLGRRR